MALLVVLLLISMTLGLSYAAMRSQYSAQMIQRNSDRRTSAQQAAVAGLTMAIKKMHTSGWSGVGTSISGSLGNSESYSVTYTAGDPSLLATDPDYAKYLPYRVTLLSTGTAADPSYPTQAATYQIQAVLALAPRKLSTEPTDWATMQGYTVYQTHDLDDITLELPCRIEGPVRVQRKLKVAAIYPNDYYARRRYLGDLNAMRLAGLSDYRPVSGPVTWNLPKQDLTHIEALGWLGVTANNAPTQTVAADWTKPTSLASYQLYPGGPTYAIPTVGSTLANISLGPDPQTNPLGIFYSGGTVVLGANVTLRGSLICKDDVRVEGANLALQPVDAPALYGSTAPVHLPTISCQNFLVKPTGGGSVAGLVAVFDKFEVEKGPETARFAVTGRVVTRKLYVQERDEWNPWPGRWLLIWLTWHECYDFYDDPFHPPDLHFPVWMNAYHGRNPAPLVTIKPDPAASPIQYHWHNWYDPIYVRHPDDAGLRWDLMRWTESP